MARGQKSFQHLNKSPVNDDEIYDGDALQLST